MKHSYKLFESSLVLTSKGNVPTPELSLKLRETSESVAPYFKPESCISIEDAKQRRSKPSGGGITIQNIGDLLDLSMFQSCDIGKRPYPAAGGVYSIQFFLLVFQVEG